ncbi:hypothetical protein KSP40_PGU015633 [Platanthera guangdongensis]|uniref:PHD-type domain-containing protein n=1 Tax=Platanthera guangdongensis TaxID=2320717 RepID=A0ABR2MRX6_9ASPA
MNRRSLMRSFGCVKYAIAKRLLAFALLPMYHEKMMKMAPHYFGCIFFTLNYVSVMDKKLLLRCSCCGQQVHPACLMPPYIDLIPDEWSCYSCKEKTDEYLHARDAYVAELLKRYEAASERKLKILDIIKSLDLPNNPLDDIIDQVQQKSSSLTLLGCGTTEKGKQKHQDARTNLYGKNGNKLSVYGETLSGMIRRLCLERKESPTGWDEGGRCLDARLGGEGEGEPAVGVDGFRKEEQQKTQNRVTGKMKCGKKEGLQV